MSSNPQTATQTISTRFDADTLARLEEISQAQKRSRSDIIKEAVDGYLNAMAWLESEVKKGLDDVKAGRVVSHEEVKDKYRKLGLDVD